MSTLINVIVEGVKTGALNNDTRNKMIAAADAMIESIRKGNADEVSVELSELVKIKPEPLGGEDSIVYYTLIELIIKIKEVLDKPLDTILREDEERCEKHTKRPERFNCRLSPSQWMEKPKCLVIDNEQIQGYMREGYSLDLKDKKFSLKSIEEVIPQSGIDGVAYCDMAITDKILQARVSLGKFLLVPIPNLSKRFGAHFIFSDGADKGSLPIYFQQHKSLRSLMRQLVVLDVVPAVKDDAQATIAYQAWSKIYGVNESFMNWLEDYNKDFLKKAYQDHDPKALEGLVGGVEVGEINGFNVIYHQLVNSGFKLRDKYLVQELNRAIKTWVESVIKGKKRFLPKSAFLATTKDPFAHQERFVNKDGVMKGIKSGYVVLAMKNEEGEFYLRDGQAFEIRYPFGDIREINYNKLACKPEHFESLEAYKFYTSKHIMKAYSGTIVFSHHDSTEFQQGADWDKDPMLICWDDLANKLIREM